MLHEKGAGKMKANLCQNAVTSDAIDISEQAYMILDTTHNRAWLGTTGVQVTG